MSLEFLKRRGLYHNPIHRRNNFFRFCRNPYWVAPAGALFWGTLPSRRTRSARSTASGGLVQGGTPPCSGPYAPKCHAAVSGVPCNSAPASASRAAFALRSDPQSDRARTQSNDCGAARAQSAAPFSRGSTVGPVPATDSGQATVRQAHTHSSRTPLATGLPAISCAAIQRLDTPFQRRRMMRSVLRPEAMSLHTRR